MTEGEIQSEIRLALGMRGDVRLFRNNQGLAWQGKVVARTSTTITLSLPRVVRFVLAEGGSDLIGLQQVTITPEMVGQSIGAFVAMEVKKPNKDAEDQQEKFLNMVRGLGGKAGVVRSAEDALRVLRYGK